MNQLEFLHAVLLTTCSSTSRRNFYREFDCFSGRLSGSSKHSQRLKRPFKGISQLRLSFLMSFGGLPMTGCQLDPVSTYGCGTVLKFALVRKPRYHFGLMRMWQKDLRRQFRSRQATENMLVSISMACGSMHKCSSVSPILSHTHIHEHTHTHTHPPSLPLSLCGYVFLRLVCTFSYV